MKKQIFIIVTLSISFLISLSGCSGRRTALDKFVATQEPKITSKQTYVQADPDFWAAVYEPTLEDLVALRAAWVEYGQAMPETKAFIELNAALEDPQYRVLLISLFQTDYQRADLTDPALGWAVSPVPIKTIELPDNDKVLRALMPISNDWARYYMLKYKTENLFTANEVVISKPSSKAILPRKK